MSKLTEKVAEAILPVLEKENVELVDIEFEKKYGQDNLTVFVYKPDGITLDDCERVHLAIDPAIDEADPTFGQPYVLNVSSPGLDRPFKALRDFQRNYGTEVEVKLFAPLKGKKTYEGVLICRDENTTTIKAALRAASKTADKKRGVKGGVNDGVKNAEEGLKTDNTDSGVELKIENNKIALVRPLIKF